MSPHDGPDTPPWSNIIPPKPPAFLHNLISNIAQDFLHKDSKLLLTSLTPSKLLLDNNGNKLSVNNLDQDCLFKLLNREDVIAAVAGKLGPTHRARANGLEKQETLPGNPSPLYKIPNSLYSALLVYPSPFHWNVRAMVAAYITISVVASKLEAPVSEIMENVHWKQNLVSENSIELVMDASLVRHEWLEEKLVTIDMEKGEMVIEIPDKVLERGSRKCGEIFRKGIDLMEEASITLISN
eukprot:TRINITY_DN55245_c0_g1_i1.p1 TRINITY_DN55245_c0_g1~~TRINITY_DN55245_c0_g1_i1.p1  ORF type:complete len:265 (-),score=84.29 TRINITY_DN55245_c0_g1_i1:31-750(-)